MSGKHGFGSKKKFPWRKVQCQYDRCKMFFETRNPRKKFCKESCRVSHWQSLQPR